MRLLATAVPAYRHQSVFKKCKNFEIATQWLRHASSNSATAVPSNVGILGGGISGLSSAIFILMMHEKKYPGTKLPKITIYEANNRLGGWMQTAKVVPGAGLEPVYMEQGPRTIRLSSIGGLIFTALIMKLGLGNNIRHILKTDPVIRSRYLYTGKNQLYKIPSTLPEVVLDILSADGTLLPVVWHMLRNYWKVHKKPIDGPSDESVAEFMSRLGGEYVVDNIFSAIIHGVWAGSVDELSIRAFNSRVSTRLWKMYEDGDLSISQVQGMFNVKPSRAGVPLHQKHWLSWAMTDPEIQEAFRSRMSLSTAFYMKDGLSQVVQTLEMALRMLPDLDIKTDTKIQSLEPHKDGVMVHTQSTSTSTSNISEPHDVIISTLPPHSLVNLTSPNKEAGYSTLTPTLEPDYSVTVGTVTFWLPDPNLIPYVGFGYLIPRTVPSHLNPHSALGVLFEHHATPDHDTNATQGTRLTVMLGGHHWNKRSGSSNDTTAPDYSDAELVRMAKETLKIQLGVDMDAQEGVYTLARLNKQCIPQHVIGHTERFEAAVEQLDAQFGPGRIRLAGTAWIGPGVTDCVEMAYQTAFDIVKPPIPE